ncbi:MAG: PspA/IM30 family protein [Pseudomonas sp.]|uniref:PspA/IM30 family protein n=1 Tax=Pseudomonas sp. TaxID=306 RepID=UPI003394A9FE
MNLWMKLGSLFRGQARESLERVVDANALCILDQELHDADAALLAARQQLTLLCAQRVGHERERAAQRQRLQEREQQVQAALQRENEALALEVAEQVALLETTLGQQDTQIDRLVAQELKLKERMRTSARLIQEHRRELVLVRATASAQRASAMIGSHQEQIHSRVGAMQESLARIKARQQSFEDQEQAAQTLLDEEQSGPLERRLQQAGIGGQGAVRVLERLRATQLAAGGLAKA